MEVHPAAVALNTEAGRDNHNRNKADGKQAIRFVILLSVYVVDQADPSWNLLLVELSRLSKIVEQSANNRNHESSSTAALGQRER